MQLNIENLVRSAAVIAIGLPLTLGLSGTLGTLSELAQNSVSEKDDAIAAFKAELTVPCLKYMMSKNDSKPEREAKDLIDEALGGEVNHGGTCEYVLK